MSMFLTFLVPLLKQKTIRAELNRIKFSVLFCTPIWVQKNNRHSLAIMRKEMTQHSMSLSVACSKYNHRTSFWSVCFTCKTAIMTVNCDISMCEYKKKFSWACVYVTLWCEYFLPLKFFPIFMLVTISLSSMNITHHKAFQYLALGSLFSFGKFFLVCVSM